ncbi:YaiI/YqxD family protein [Spongiibacter sp. KMU-158]|uniref:UPF0178 protein IB286_02405 n=1 Tax=Spongiibacter pelagi TaxID=2760804 RepID=A0A927C0C3_9GAMM|nr:YaiI/YqxD family protein [Spongiibacter pelagi]MBD2857843.1 YaiI/YqxD family protein [Spongiibacter pelagi]
MKIWVDADACPVAARDILYRAARRTGLELIMVANRAVPVPPDANIRSLQVSQGFDVADNFIVENSEANDLVISSDIPLAAELIAKGAAVVSFRGERYTADNIKGRLNIRDFMETMRASGVQSGGQSAYGQREKQEFANQLDRYLAQAVAAKGRRST